MLSARTAQDCHGFKGGVGGSGYRIGLALALSEPTCGGCGLKVLQQTANERVVELRLRHTELNLILKLGWDLMR